MAPAKPEDKSLAELTKTIYIHLSLKIHHSSEILFQSAKSVATENITDYTVVLYQIWCAICFKIIIVSIPILKK